MAVVSHKHKFIFVKTTKTAGTAIEITLSSCCGLDDIFTPFFPGEPEHQARNFIHNNGRFYNHMTANEICKLVGSHVFESYFKFCVERDPIDKCLSHFAMLKNSSYHNKETYNLTWEYYVEQRNFPIDTSKYIDISGKLIVDAVLRYARLESELAELFSKLKVPWQGLKSRAKSGFRNGVPEIKDVSKFHREIILEKFAQTRTALERI